MRALRCAFTSRPRPGITKMPFFLVSLTAMSVSCSRNAAAVLLLVSSFLRQMADELRLGQT